MPCFFPLQASFSVRSDGKKSVRFSGAMYKLFKLGFAPFDKDSAMSLPCGRCQGCRLEKSRQWAVRCVHESKMYEDNCFVTLTYASDKVPLDGSLCRKHVQDFLKRLRFEFSHRKIRVFYCGEYGDKLGRPHYHLCLFNVQFFDRERWYKHNDFWYYISDQLTRLWPFGHSTVCDFSFETAAYVARYCTKKVNGALAEEHYQGRTPEFAGMSNRPGIGKPWFDMYGRSDVIPHDSVMSRNVPAKLPRYYDVLWERVAPESFAEAKEARRKRGELKQDDNSFRRLATKLKCMEGRFSQLVRRMESGL